MNLDDERAAIADPAIPAAPPAGRSLIDRIRERHERRDPTLDLAIPRWGGDVVVRFGRLPIKAVTASARRKAPAQANAELLVAACREILVRDEDGDLQPAASADDIDAPVRFDGRLADLFDLRGAETPRAIALAMYADTVAVGAHAKRVFDWQTGADLDESTVEEVDDLAGEAEAAT